jgi:hemolysin III
MSASASDGRPLHLNWNYDRAEIVADGVVHVVGVLCGTVAVVSLVAVAAKVAKPVELIAVLVYGGGLLGMLTASALYNLWPLSPRKWLLRRLDHSAIFLLIAGTYTPFLTQLKSGFGASLLFVGVWSASLVGMTLKLALPGRFDRLSIALYLLIGWSGVVAYEGVVASLPEATLWLLAAGGMLYTLGVVFHLWRSLRFQNAIWHALVLAAAACHYGAVLNCIVLDRA